MKGRSWLLLLGMVLWCGSQWQAALTTEDTRPMLLAYRQPADPVTHYAWLWPGRSVLFGDPADAEAPMWAVITHRLGDLDHDGRVNVGDLQVIRAAWGTADGLSDLNTDGVVDGSDLALLVEQWSR